jgi:hypothetical protein
VRGSARLATLAIVFCAGAARPAAWGQQQPSRLEPEQPKNGDSVGVRPKFVLRADAEDVSKLRFRIELSRDGFKTVAYTFDQLREPNGWAYLEMETEPPGAAYFPQKKLAGGQYIWRVSSWDGLSWQTARSEFRVTIDDVPPAEVQGVRMTRDPSSGCVHVTWNPVATDEKGGPERVLKYHIFRYWERTTVPSIGPFEAGTATEAHYDDCDPATRKRPLVFYRVEAEDEAGNVFGRRSW